MWTIYGKFTFNVHNDHSVLYIDSSAEHKTTFEEYYELELDDGWEITYHDKITEEVGYSYKQGEKGIIFSQSIIHQKNGNVNTEDAKIEPISIYRENDALFIELNNGEYYLIWVYDGYLFEIISNLDKEEVTELAKCTKIKN